MGAGILAAAAIMGAAAPADAASKTVFFNGVVDANFFAFNHVNTMDMSQIHVGDQISGQLTITGSTLTQAQTTSLPGTFADPELWSIFYTGASTDYVVQGSVTIGSQSLVTQPAGPATTSFAQANNNTNDHFFRLGQSYFGPDSQQYEFAIDVKDLGKTLFSQPATDLGQVQFTNRAARLTVFDNFGSDLGGWHFDVLASTQARGGGGAGGGGPTVDGVPEPMTWALMLMGFGLLGGELRRRGVSATA